MRYFLRIGSVALLFWTGNLWAQTVTRPTVVMPSSYGGGMWGQNDYGGNTVEGSYLNGLASVIRAQGDYNLSTSAAAINWTTAARQSIQNNKDYVEAYFAIRAFNRQARDAESAKERQLTQEWLRFHPSVKPKRLSSSELDPVSGTINWPILLQSDDLAEMRQNIQKAFSERHQLGVMDHNNYRMVQQLSENLLTDIFARIQNLTPSEYIQAKRFIEALLYEASLPLG